MGWGYGWAPYVPVAERRRKALQKVEKLKKKGQVISPVNISGRKIADTFWGKAWCDNLESYSDYINRLPRGRTYVRNGSVLDLQLKNGQVEALVSGSDIYTVKIHVKPLIKDTWQSIQNECAGKIASLVDLLKGHLSGPVMEIVTRKQTGLFPSPREMSFQCSCPDWASMCKHVAAVLYGVGARLDHSPELLFSLRGVNHEDLMCAQVAITTLATADVQEKMIAQDELSAIFGIDIDTRSEETQPPSAKKRPGRPKTDPAKKQAKAKKTSEKTPKAPKKHQGKADTGKRPVTKEKRPATPAAKKIKTVSETSKKASLVQKKKKTTEKQKVTEAKKTSPKEASAMEKKKAPTPVKKKTGNKSRTKA